MPWSKDDPTEGMSPEQLDEYYEIGQEHSEKHQELSLLLNYPPFTLDKEDHEEFRLAVIAVPAEQYALFKRTQTMDRDAYVQMEKEFDDEIEEAKLYQSRHGDDFVAAQKAGITDSDMAADDEQLYQLEPK
jgi:predicted transcriptional regulator YdeE